MDSPARAAWLNIKQFNGYNDCQTCTEPGEQLDLGPGKKNSRRQCHIYPFNHEEARATGHARDKNAFRGQEAVEELGFLCEPRDICVNSKERSSGFCETEIQKLQRELDELKKKSDMNQVDYAINQLQQLISRPASIFDRFAALAALEHVVNVAHEKGDDRALRHSIILRQCRQLVDSPALQSALTKLVASKEEAEVAKVLEKAVKGA
ncbi:hypothetical protein OS493_020841 [Desmophyllum pertusum]|uniref:Uncharacterized protein n=1 Tax=Desmophyllum pertusum TaxID=174260 RepID=A0A9W9YBB2_9CNID|nr:hypothetical protein OS493_020841 [Desmophyllum pertusum]